MDKFEIAKEILGWSGKMISSSKSYYSDRHPNNLVLFNSNICVESGKIWFGDFDITKDEKQLIQLAKKLNETIYVLREMDGRFDNEKSPKFERFVLKVSSDGKCELGSNMKEFYTRINGKFRLKDQHGN